MLMVGMGVSRCEMPGLPQEAAPAGRLPRPVPVRRLNCASCCLRLPLAPPLPRCRSILGDSYRTALHLVHPPHLVALGSLALAASITQLDLRAWLQGLDADFAQVWQGEEGPLLRTRQGCLGPRELPGRLRGLPTT